MPSFFEPPLRARGCAPRRRRPARDDERVLELRHFDRKPLWVRKHSCPSCGFKADRDLNAVVRLRLTGSKIARDFATAYNILSRGLDQTGVVHSDSMSSERASRLSNDLQRLCSLWGTDSVPVKRVTEAGSPALPGLAASLTG